MLKTIAVLATSALISFSAFASDYTYKCEQRTDRSPIDPSVGKISVVITHVKRIASATEYRGEYVDIIDSVQVLVSAKKNGKTTVLKSTSAVATSEDVMFNINSNGIKFHLYMDELEEAGIALKINGKKADVSLGCQ